MAIHRLADQHENHDEWLAARERFITSSNLFTFIGHNLPDWWDDDPHKMLARKLAGEGADFADEARVSMQHGIHDERGIQKKFGEEIGAETEADHGFYANDNIPGVGASIDGWVYYPDRDPEYKYAQRPVDMVALRGQLRDMLHPNEAFLCEIKKSTSSKWQTEIPIYYRTQLQAQMHVLEIDAAVIVAECIVWLKPKGEKRKRPFWDLRAYITHRDPAFLPILQEAGQRWLRASAEHGAMCIGGDNGDTD